MEPADISVLVCNYCTRTNIRPLGNSLLFYLYFFCISKSFLLLLLPTPSSSLFSKWKGMKERERKKNGAPGLLIINAHTQTHKRGHTQLDLISDPWCTIRYHRLALGSFHLIEPKSGQSPQSCYHSRFLLNIQAALSPSFFLPVQKVVYTLPPSFCIESS